MTVSRRTLLGWSAAGAALVATGCPQAVEQPQPAQDTLDERPLRVLLVAASERYASKLQRFWQAQSDAPFELRIAAPHEILAAKRFKADVIVYPSRLLGAFAADERIAPLSRALTDGDLMHAGDLLRHVRTTEVTWGAKTMAVCLGLPTYVLLYRQDRFEELSLSPPATWMDYQQVAQQLQQQDPASITCEPLADAADQVLLARAAAYVRHRNDYGGLFDLKSMTPLIAEPPYVRALEEMAATSKVADRSQLLTQSQVLEKLLAGEAAMGWAWLPAGDSSESKFADKLAVTRLPGSTDVFDFRGKKWSTRESNDDTRVPLLGAAGMLGSVTTEARRPKAAENFLAWLSAGENAVEVAASQTPAAPFRRSHLAQLKPWVPQWLTSGAAEQYAEALRAINEQSIVLQALRIPGEAEYASALQSAVAAAVLGEKTPAAALGDAALAFEQITNRLGRDQQRLNYQRSIGLDA